MERKTFQIKGSGLTFNGGLGITPLQASDPTPPSENSKGNTEPSLSAILVSSPTTSSKTRAAGGKPAVLGLN